MGSSYSAPLQVDNATLEVVAGLLRVKDAGISEAKLAGTVPLGRIASATKTSDQTVNVASMVDITGLSVTWTAVSGRYYQILANVRVAEQTDAANIESQLVVAGSPVQARNWVAMGQFYGVTFPFDYLTNGLSGSVTAKIQGQRGAGVGTALFVGGSTTPTFLYVNDLGT
jgi:hypothetical protein